MAEITHESVALYALGALDKPDCERFETHLVGCERCGADVVTLTAAAALLASAIAPVPPPPSLRGRILEEAQSSSE